MRRFLRWKRASPAHRASPCRGLTHGRTFFAVLGTLAGFILVASLLVWSPLGDASAQEKPAGPKPSHPATPKPAPASPRPTAQQQTMPVSIEQALYLVRSTLLTLNDANLSGNYTVLRDLAAPDFQARNTAADLGQTFSDLRRRNFDLYGAALLAPQLTVVPALDQAACCIWPATSRRGRSRSISISCSR